MSDQLRSGIIEQVSKGDTAFRTHYLPHHPVVRPDKTTTKVRVVFDGSSKQKKDDQSLNECLLRGPVFLQDLCSLILRFRTFKYAFTADIEKAFLQVGLKAEDRDVTRFFWTLDPNKPFDNDNIAEYRFCRVLFGIISSPFLLDATIKHHLRAQNSSIADQLANNMYVDNVIGGTDCGEDGIQFYNVAKMLFSEISMNIREWYTNSTSFRESICAADAGTDSTPKVLGMRWNLINDTISCAPVVANHLQVQTKKHLVQAVCRLFDPCGFFSPVTVVGKLMVQSLWQLKLKWDDKLSEDILDQWNGYKTDYQRISTVSIPRHVTLSQNRELSQGLELHTFCDASSKAYAAVVYARNGTDETNILFAKSRLAPLKSLSLPRLELMAIVVGVRISKFVAQSLKIDNAPIFLWTDSKCSLYWIKSSKLLATFVMNRVREVKSHNISEFRYVPTQMNPADLPTRGVKTQDLAASRLWWHGPEFLKEAPTRWPQSLSFHGEQCPYTDAESKDSHESTMLNQRAAYEGLAGINVDNFPTLARLKRTTAWVLRFVDRTSKRRLSLPDSLTAEELDKALLQWIKYTQHWYFASISGEKMKSLKQHLKIFKDESGFFRCQSRLRFAEVPEDTKTPLFLPKRLKFTSLVINQAHWSIFHAGVTHTLSKVRQRFWIPDGRAEVKRAIRGCLVCRRWEGKAFRSPEMAPLPPFRVQRTAPYQFVGVDYFGPLIVKEEDTGNSKRWACIFTCASTRALHLELVHSMSSDCFLQALRRFIAVCGKPDVVISDTARQFKTTKQAVQKLFGDPSRCADFLAAHSITWKFIPAYSPWMGGFYERLIADIKRALKKTLGLAQVTHNELQTLLYEIAAVLNTIPLVSSGHLDDPMLTPAHLIGKPPRFGSSLTESTNDEIYQETIGHADQLVSSWRKRSRIVNQFWNIWYTSYLTSLRERSTAVHNYNTDNTVPTIDTIVLVKEKAARATWKIGKIQHLHTSMDGAVRSATVRFSSGKTSKRPLRMLYPLECSKTEDIVSSGSAKGEHLASDPLQVETRQKRTAAVKARHQISKQLSSEDTE